MWLIIRAGVNFLLSSVLSTVAVKFVVYTAVLVLIGGFIEVLQAQGIFPSAAGINGALVNLPPSAWYFLDLFAANQGIPLVFAALVSRFILRRIPLIG